jgi:hypothetical protein
MKFIKLVAGAALLLLTSSSFAIPLTLNYQVTDLGSTYQYDFELVLDNHDNSWVAGQEWDWFVFGDRKGSFLEEPAFDCAGWHWLSVPVGFGGNDNNCSSGGHQGPLLYVGVSPAFPGWSPAVIGESIQWSGTYNQFVGLADMWWAPVLGPIGTNGFHQAGNVSLPEPAPFLLLGLGLFSLMFARRRAV